MLNDGINLMLYMKCSFFFFFQGPWPTAKASLLTIEVEVRNTYSHVDYQSSDHKLHIHKL